MKKVFPFLIIPLFVTSCTKFNSFEIKLLPVGSYKGKRCHLESNAPEEINLDTLNDWAVTENPFLLTSSKVEFFDDFMCHFYFKFLDDSAYEFDAEYQIWQTYNGQSGEGYIKFDKTTYKLSLIDRFGLLLFLENNNVICDNEIVVEYQLW